MSVTRKSRAMCQRRRLQMQAERMCQECVPFIFVPSPDKVQIKQPPPRKSTTDLETAKGSDTSRRFKKFTALCVVGTKKPKFEGFGKREPLEQENGKPKEEKGGHNMDSVDQVDESTVKIGDLQPRRGRKRRKRNTNDHNPLYIAATECSQGEFKISDGSIVGSEIWPPSCGEIPPCARQRDQSMASALVECGKKARVEMWFCKQGLVITLPLRFREADDPYMARDVREIKGQPISASGEISLFGTKRIEKGAVKRCSREECRCNQSDVSTCGSAYPSTSSGGPQATCTAILQHVQDTLDHSISTRTISRRSVANGLHSCRPLRRLPLTSPNRRQRLEWCRARSTWMTEWHRVVFSDESRFCLSSDSRRVRVWRRRGERSNPAAIVERPTVRQRGIMVWGAIAYDCRSPLLRIQGTMTAQRYVDDVLRPVTLPYLQGVPNALYQQDNARPHTARISQQALQDVQMLPWPPYSPDLSPIEHVWDIIGRRLHALPQPRSEDELWQMVEREWRAIPQDAIRTLIDSLPRRVAACIAVRETLVLMNEAYEDEKLSRAQVYFWYKCFKDGRKSIADDSRSVRPLTSTTDRNIGQRMTGHRKRRRLKQTDAFTRGMVIGLKRAGWSIRQIAADTHLGASTVHRLGRRWLEQGNVAIYRNVGATRVTSARVDRRILRQAVAAPQATCTAILQHVQDTLDHSISTRTISRRLVANGLHSCRPLRRLPLTPSNRRQRLEWCLARSTWMTEWHRVVFSDESRFCLSSDSRRVRVWRRRGERSNPAAIVERPTVRQRGIMVSGAIAYDSRSPLLRIQGTMTAQRYVDDMLRPVTLPYLQGVPNALYQQDNARTHTARISQQALQDVQMLRWPPYSPDLSPIEHVWDIIGRRLHVLPQPRSEGELWQMVEREWRAIPQDAIRTLIDSLPRRVGACIAVR
ncbi:Transposase, partial [Cordylochernes scorpioides]